MCYVLNMVRNLRSGATVGGDGEVGGAKTKKKRPPRLASPPQGRTEVCCEAYIQGIASKI